MIITLVNCCLGAVAHPESGNRGCLYLGCQEFGDKILRADFRVQ